MIAVRVPWVLIAGGFHQRGGMDKANAALATHLVQKQIPVHLVAHHVDASLAAQSDVTVHLVPRPLRSFLLGERALERRGLSVARAVTARVPDARVVVNGGNCAWPDINWMHCVHHAWQCADAGAPAWFRVKNRLEKAAARRRERHALATSRLVIANSERTRREIVTHLRVDANRVHTVYPGWDPLVGPPTREARRAARAELGLGDRPCVVFLGALGHDDNKGLTTLWRAWARLCARTDWDGDLVIAGGGRAVDRWRALVAGSARQTHARVLGFTERVDQILDAADLLVSPVRYEAYGLGIQEAVGRGVPVLVSASAGIAERFPADVRAMLLASPDDADEVMARLLGWRRAMDHWRQQFARLGAEVRRYTWDDMAARIVALAEGARGDVFAASDGLREA